MKKEHTHYTKKELHEFANTIQWDKVNRWVKEQELIAEYPDVTNRMTRLEDMVSRSIRKGSIRSKLELIGRISDWTPTDIRRLAELHGLDLKAEEELDQKLNRKHNNGKYLNEYSDKVARKYPNLSDSKIKKLRVGVIEHLKSKMHYPTTVERVAMHFEVKKKYIHNIFQELQTKNYIKKADRGKSNDAWHDDAWEPNFWFVRPEIALL